MHVASLAIYPVKGVRAVSSDAAEVEAMGLVGDRRWMIVDANNRFISQREEPRLAQMVAEPAPTGLTLVLPDQQPIEVATPDGSKRAVVTIWRSTVNAAIAEGAVNDRLSAFLGGPATLVFMDDKTSRMANAAWAGEGASVSFADAYPVLLTSLASLEALNEVIVDQGGEAISMNRFRPNIVLEDTEPWGEDRWAVIRIGDVVFDLVKPCDRCVVPTFDQQTGDARADEQPIRALTAIRRSADERVKGVLFGWNMIARTGGVIRVGDDVGVLEGREAWAIRP